MAHILLRDWRCFSVVVSYNYPSEWLMVTSAVAMAESNGRFLKKNDLRVKQGSFVLYAACAILIKWIRMQSCVRQSGAKSGHEEVKSDLFWSFPHFPILQDENDLSPKPTVSAAASLMLVSSVPPRCHLYHNLSSLLPLMTNPLPSFILYWFPLIASELFSNYSK